MTDTATRQPPPEKSAAELIAQEGCWCYVDDIEVGLESLTPHNGLMPHFF
jgi:hypothetical protein